MAAVRQVYAAGPPAGLRFSAMPRGCGRRAEGESSRFEITSFEIREAKIFVSSWVGPIFDGLTSVECVRLREQRVGIGTRLAASKQYQEEK
jgi:hypothetical protein